MPPPSPPAARSSTGASDNAAAADARQTARVNLEHSPAGATATISDSLVYDDGHAGDPSYLASGVLISGTSVRVAISSTLGTTLGKVVGVQSHGDERPCTLRPAGLPGPAPRRPSLPQCAGTRVTGSWTPSRRDGTSGG